MSFIQAYFLNLLAILGLMVLTDVLFIPVALSLYLALRRVRGSAMLVATAFVVLAADLVLLRSSAVLKRALAGAVLSSIGCALAGAWMMAVPEQTNFLSGILVLDAPTRVTKIALLVLAVGTVLISTETEFTIHVGEFFALLLLGLSAVSNVVVLRYAGGEPWRDDPLLLDQRGMGIVQLDLHPLADGQGDELDPRPGRVRECHQKARGQQNGCQSTPH